MTSEIRTNSLKSRAGLSTVTMTDSGPMFSGITTFVDNSGFTFGVGGGTSIFTPATNVLTFGTNNTEKIRIDASGHMHGVGVITATHFYGDGSNLTGLTVPGGGTGLDLNDNVKIRIGTGTDLELYHDGSHSHINEETGNLLVGVEGEFQVLNRQENEYRIRAHNNGGVDLYYDHTKRFETTAHGASITGKLDLSSDLDMGDNDFIKLGDGDDLTISHDATNSTIHNQTGNLRIRNAGEFQVTKSSTENMLIAKPDGAVELYFNNQKTFSTIQSGVSLGSVTHYLLWPYDGSSNSRSWGWIGEDGAYGKFELKYSNGADTTLDELSIRSYANGTVELFYDNSKKLNTHASGIHVSGGIHFGASSGSDPVINNAEDTNEISFQTGGAYRLRIQDDGHTRPSSNNSYDLGTSSYRWRNVYSQDLQLSNEAKKDEGGNDVDGTWGDYTIQEGESDLFLINNRNGKKYTFLLKEVT